MKTVRLLKGEDGKAAFMNTTAINARAALACNLMAATMTSDVLKQHLSDEGPERLNPRKIASIACDLANAMYAEIEQREWILDYPVPENATELGAI